ncbi:MAG: TonB-dependent receptor [Verrucomicrobiota bacterium]
MSQKREDTLTTHQKALELNLDNSKYGTFAEIGAGQEVVRWFFRVGGAAGTIAKSMSAYDMKVSDAIYGSSDRYVSRSRLQAMLDYEHQLNIERLTEARGLNTSFFAFADTVSARNFKGTNECHGWMGMKFQAHPRDEDSQVIIHVRMLDNENSLQQEALGMVGVNLVYACCFLSHEPDRFIESLLDGLTLNRIEIDMIEFSGIEFRHVDNRLMSLKLVQLGLSNAAMFAADGTVLQPSEVLRKKNILVERGSYRPVCNVNLDILRSAQTKFIEDEGVEEDDIISVMELTMVNLMATGEIDYQDFLARASVMGAAGSYVLISNYFEYYRLAAYLSRYTSKKIGIAMGAKSLVEIFDEHYYENLPGGILESFGRLFKNDLKLYIYPYRHPETNELITVENVEIPDEIEKLYDYLVEKGNIIQLDKYDEACLGIFSRDILRRIKAKDTTWETMVPEEVASRIKRHGFFGYKA